MASKNSLADRIKAVTEQPPESIPDSLAERIDHEIAATIHKTKLPDQSLLAQHHEPPTYGEPQRSAINSVVDNIVRDICEEITELRLALDEVEQKILENSAAVKGRLGDHVSICVGVKDEVVHIRRIIDDIKARAE